MSKSLVIVESPAKARTIGKFLGAGFDVRASMGHVRDLPRSGLCVYPDKDFAADWEPIADRAKVVAELRKLASRADTIYLATDPDREGEAIAWHLLELLLGQSSAKELKDRVRRVHFHEITRPAIEEAFKHPGVLDERLVDSYLARRLLDRLVGYQLSELLWKKLTRGLSAGRVQSVAVKLVVEREREIRAFEPEEYWKLVARFPGPAEADGKAGGFAAEFKRLDGKAKPLHSALDVAAVLARTAKTAGSDWAPLAATGAQPAPPDDAAANALSGRELSASGPFRVAALKQTPKRESAKPPFKTSTLQQAASGRYGFAPQRTMRVAQQLYEGIELPGEGAVGLITYMRTDSFAVAGPAQNAARELIGERYGERFVPEKPNRYRSGASAQEAHEAIRPTDPRRIPEAIRRALTEEQWKLYELIWRRFLASQMSPAEHLVTTLELERGGATFTASGRVTTFAGWTAVYGGEARDEAALPELSEGQELLPESLLPSRHFTKPPRRYSEASLVKALEEHGIGRPSTYASILSTIVDRKYVDHGEESEQDKLRQQLFAPAEPVAAAPDEDEEPPAPATDESVEDEEALVGGRRRKGSALHATHLGEVVTDLLEPSFTNVVDYKFTARFEDDLDGIAEGRQRWQDVVRGFYDRFIADLTAARDGMQHYRSNPLAVPDLTCDKADEKTGAICGAPMVVLFNRGGAYLGCSRYPECSNNVPLSGVRSSTGEITEHRCRAKNEKTGVVCDRQMELKTNRWGRRFLACTGYKDGDCKGAVSVSSKGEPLWPVETSVPCPLCGRVLSVKRARGNKKFLACPGYPKCRGALNLPSCTHESRGGKVCGLAMSEPAPDGLMACREHGDVRLPPPPPSPRKGGRGAKGGAEGEDGGDGADAVAEGATAAAGGAKAKKASARGKAKAGAATKTAGKTSAKKPATKKAAAKRSAAKPAKKKAAARKPAASKQAATDDPAPTSDA